MIYVLLVVLGGGAAIGYRLWSRYQTHKRLLASPLSLEDRAILADEVPILRKLPADLRPAIEGKINLFLHQVTFHGCDGLEVSDGMRLSIAAQACLLVVNKKAWYKTLRTILVYPGAFQSRQTVQVGYVATEETTTRIGESWGRGPVVLSWAHTQGGARQANDGHNVVFHEFAHQLDDLSGAVDGGPVMRKGQDFGEWSRVMIEAHARLEADVAAGRATFLDPYGAQSHWEFFAVAVEVFFEKPAEMQREEHAVYAQLSTYFGLDPAAW